MLTQEKFTANGLLAADESSKLWQIPIKVVTMFDPFTPSAEVLMTDKEMELTIDGIWRGEWVKLNPNYFGFYRVNYPTEMLEKFIPSIETKSMPPLDRLNIQSDLFAMTQSGRLSTVYLLKYLNHYDDEDDPAVWNSIFATLMKLELLVTDTDFKNMFRMYATNLLTKIYDKVGWDAQSKEDSSISVLRPRLLSILGRFKKQSVIREAIKRFNNYSANKTAIQREMVSTVYGIVGANSDEELYNKIFDVRLERL